ncbi:hypothetical protein WI99_15080 [Burkholderia cepacia]|nr:hypothetical protein WI99_15080 [Burkholderia cepacia]
MTSIEKNTGSNVFIVTKEARNLRIGSKATLIQAYAEIQFDYRKNIGDRSRAKTKPVAQLLCMLFGECRDVALIEAALRWVISSAPDAEYVLHFSIRLNQVVE